MTSPILLSMHKFFIVSLSIMGTCTSDVFNPVLESFLQDRNNVHCIIIISDESMLALEEFSIPLIHMDLNDLPNEFNQTQDIGGQYGNRLKKASKYMVLTTL